VQRKIKEEIKMALNTKAEDLKFFVVRKRISEPMNIKSFPKYLKDRNLAIFDWEWDEIRNNIIYPIEFKDKLYHSWNFYPEEVKEMCRKGIEVKRIEIFRHHFSEGMNRDYSVKTWTKQTLETK